MTACDAKSATVTGLLSFFSSVRAATRLRCTSLQIRAAARTARSAVLNSASRFFNEISSPVGTTLV